MGKGSHRERLLEALQHKETDRPPLDMMGNATMLLDQTYLRLRDHLGLAPIPPIRSGSTANYYDERILEYFDIDFRRVFLPKNPAWVRTNFPDGSYLDEFGVRNVSSGPYVNFVDHPLRQATGVKEVEAYSWPSPDDLFSTKGLAERARQLWTETDYAIVARNPITFGFLDRSCSLMGIAEFMMAMALQPDVVQAVIAHLLDIYKGIYGMFLEAVGPYVQMVEYGDDLGAQNNSLISPQMFDRFLAPAEQELFNLIREKAPQAVIFHHTDGSIFKLIPSLIDAGVGVLNPVQTSSKGMDAHLLKNTYGQRLTFHGAIEKLESPVDVLVAEVKEKLEIFTPGGGYIFASCNHMMDVPPENILAMFATAAEFRHARTQTFQKSTWGNGKAYESYVGRWSRLVAREFLDWLDIPSGCRWLDVGCGTGMLSRTILESAAPGIVRGIDKSDSYIAFARRQIQDGRAHFEVGDAQALPVGTAEFDVAVSGLALNFIPTPKQALIEMARAVRPGGKVACYVWDYAGKMQFMRHFWNAAVALDRAAYDLDEGRRSPLCNPEPLTALFRSVNLKNIEVIPIDIATDFSSFDDYWLPFLGGQGPAPGYAMSLSEERRVALRERIRASLPFALDGSIPLVARVWAVKGTVEST